MSRYFITGTDTGVGKTFISCVLASVWHSEGRKVGVFKPAETGCIMGSNGLIADDADRLLAASGSNQEQREVCPVRFSSPAAPLVAAESEGTDVNYEDLLRRASQLSADYDSLIIEGAGGLLVPLSDGKTYLDFVKSLGLPIIVVVGSKLGCINHALLTLQALESHRLKIAGYILNEILESPQETLAHQTHRKIINRFSNTRDLGHMPFTADCSSLVELGRRYLDLKAL
ncbi:dethiobiotin synthase [Myxococcota bacterium]|nr:dethiobiotin synthase [Myxococcota bacterium]